MKITGTYANHYYRLQPPLLESDHSMFFRARFIAYCHYLDTSEEVAWIKLSLYHS